MRDNSYSRKVVAVCVLGLAYREVNEGINTYSI